MLCEVLNLASQRLPIRHTASHTAPDTRYTLHSRLIGLVPFYRKNDELIAQFIYQIGWSEQYCSYQQPPHSILHFQSADHRNRSGSHSQSQNTGRRNHCHATCSYPLYPETLFQKIESRSYSGWYSSDSSNRSSKTRVQVGNSTVRNVSELNPSKPTTVSNLYSVYSAPDHATSPHPWHGYALPSTSLILIQKIVFVDILVLFVPRARTIQDPRNRYHPAPRSDQHGQSLLGWRTVNHIPSAEITLLKPVHVFHYLGFA